MLSQFDGKGSLADRGGTGYNDQMFFAYLHL